MFRKPAASRSRFNRNMTYPFDCVQMANRGTGDGRGRIWGEGMDWTCGGLGYRSDQEDGNGISEMFGHDRSPLQRTRSFPVYGNRTRVREDSMASISPSRIWHLRHQHDQSVQSNPRPDQNCATERPQDQGAEITLKLLHDVMIEALGNQGRRTQPPELEATLAAYWSWWEKAVNVETVLEAERKTIQHSGGYTKFNQGKRPNFNNGPRSHKGKGRGSGGQDNNRGNTGVCFVATLGMEDVTCFSCGMMGHYASSCPNKPIPATPLAIRAPPSRPAIEPAPKK
ncbi:hypothetical protein F2Q69_00005740 [Brassica cretica]|uniref:CCHC-type domain-containing protein n=1 Tax=Brassica cretica TaxID=69181 RepID=A0A8S9P949_BRACR|nr:hypothetical protein F2Q69_00005740 [Brassica cretica]